MENTHADSHDGIRLMAGCGCNPVSKVMSGIRRRAQITAPRDPVKNNVHNSGVGIDVPTMGDLFHITFRYLLEIVSPIIG